MKILFLLFLISVNGYAQDSILFYFGQGLDQQTLQQYKKTPKYKTHIKYSYARFTLARIINHCIETKCIQGRDLELAKRILKAASAFQHAGRIFTADESGNFYPPLDAQSRRYIESFGIPTDSKIFTTQDSLVTRNAISSLEYGPIIMNADKELSLAEAQKVLIHEMGHQVGIPDDLHQELDHFANKFENTIKSRMSYSNNKDMNVYNHFYFDAEVIATAQDLQDYYHPHLIYEDEDYFINLTPYVFQTIPKIDPSLSIVNLWIHSIQSEKTDFGFTVSAKLGHTQYSPQDKSGVSLIGDINVSYDLKTHLVRVNYTNIVNEKQTKIRAKVIDVIKPNRLLRVMHNKVRVKLSLPLRAQLDGCELRMISPSANSPEEILQMYMLNECTSYTSLGNGEWLLNFEFPLPKDYSVKQLKLQSVRYKLKNEEFHRFISPREQIIFDIEAQNKKPFIYDSHGVYSTSVRGLMPDLNVYRDNEYIAINKFPRNAQNGIHQVLYFKKFEGEVIPQESRFFVEEIYHPPLKPKQKMYIGEEILNDFKMEMDNGLFEYTYSIDPHKLTKGLKAMRVLGMSVHTTTGFFDFIRFY